jgi:hypothetical protein
LSAVLRDSFCPTGVAVKSIFVVVVVPAVDEVDVLDVALEPVLVESLTVVVDLVDFPDSVDFPDFVDFALVVVVSPDDFDDGPCALPELPCVVDGPCAVAESPCVVDEGPCADEEPGVVEVGPCDVAPADGP